MESDEPGLAVSPGDATDGEANALAERPPTPPAFRRGDERREQLADPELCEFCQRHPRKPASRGGGPRPKLCAHVWGQDHRGKDVTCARLDDAHDLWLAVYGGTGPLSQLDVGAQARHLADLRTALEALFAVLDPVRGDLTQLDERLAGEVAGALARAEQAVADAELARRETQAAIAVRNDALAAQQQAVDDAAAARRNEGKALVEVDEARTAKRDAEAREKDANTRAEASRQTAKEATESLTTANKTISEQATQIGELTGANNQLTAQAQQLTTTIEELRGLIDQQRTEHETALGTARTEAATALQEQRTELQGKLDDQQARFDRERKDTERETATRVAELNSTITDLAGQVAQLTTRAEQATTAAESNQGAAEELNRLRTRLLTALATASPGDDAGLRAHLAELVTAAQDEEDDKVPPSGSTGSPD